MDDQTMPTLGGFGSPPDPVNLPSMDQVRACAKRIAGVVKPTRLVSLGTHLVRVGESPAVVAAVAPPPQQHPSRIAADADVALESDDAICAAAAPPPAKRSVGSPSSPTSCRRADGCSASRTGSGGGSASGDIDIYLKLENEQHCSTFKARAAAAYLTHLEQKQQEEGESGGDHEELLKHGVVVASTGSFGQCLGWQAKQRGIRCAVLAPDFTDDYRQSLLRSAGVDELHLLPFFDWWETVEVGRVPEHVLEAHPSLRGMRYVSQTDVQCLAGDGTVVAEILDAMPDVGAVVVPFGFGGLACASGVVLRSRRASSSRPRLVAVEVATSSPFRNALVAGRPRRCTHTPSFVSQLGGQMALPAIWDDIKDTETAGGGDGESSNGGGGLISQSAVVSLDAVAEAVRLLKANHDIVAEGAGASSLAAALSGQAGTGKVVCVVTGGNMDAGMLSEIMGGATPAPGTPIPPFIVAMETEPDRESTRNRHHGNGTA